MSGTSHRQGTATRGGRQGKGEETDGQRTSSHVGTSQGQLRRSLRQRRDPITATLRGTTNLAITAPTAVAVFAALKRPPRQAHIASPACDALDCQPADTRNGAPAGARRGSTPWTQWIGTASATVRSGEDGASNTVACGMREERQPC